jgi:hypothetical protein
MRQANGSTANQVAVVVGVAEDAIELTLSALSQNTNTGVGMVTGIGEDSTTAALGGGNGGSIAYVNSAVANGAIQAINTVRRIPAAGYHYYTWLEYSQAIGATTWYGDAGAPTLFQTGLFGSIKG